jgi:HK97 family phage portal protein
MAFLQDVRTSLSKFISSETRMNPLENPGISLSSPAIWQWLTNGDPTVSGELINESNAMKLSTVYGCVRTIAENIGSLPLKLMEKTSQGHKEAVEQNLYYLLSTEPNPMMDACTFIETLIGSVALTGNGYAQIERNDKSGNVVALWPLHPFKTEPKIDRRTNTMYYETSDGMPLGQTRKIPDTDILHMKRFSLDGLRGISPIDMCRQGIGLAVAQEKSGARHFGNGSNPGGILINKGDKKDPKYKKEFQDSWNQQQGGNNQGKTAILWGSEWTYQQLGLSNEASQWLQSRAFSRADIAASIFSVPPHMVGDMSRMSGTNAEQQMLQFITTCLQPYLRKFELEIVRKLTSRTGSKANRFFVMFDTSVLVRADFKTQQDGYQAGINGGWLTPNDVLRMQGLNPGGPELDVYRVPVNYQNAARLLDTESLQDQPIGAVDPTAAPTTQADRSMLQVYSRTYLPLYRDAFSRLSARKKRDYDTVSVAFRGVLQSVAGMACGCDDMTLTDDIVNDTIKSMVKRSAKWPETITNDTIDIEFQKTVRAIHIAAARQVAADKAAAEVEIETESTLEGDNNEETGN